MNVRHILVAASAAAILAGSSFGALAGSHNFSKGESSSRVSTSAFFFYDIPVAKNKQSEHTTSLVKGDGEAAAGATTSGGALALQGGIEGGSIGLFGASGFHAEGQAAAAWGSTSGSSCAGSGCNSNGNVGNP